MGGHGALSGYDLVAMCNLYRMTSNVQAIAQMFAPVANAQVNLPAFSEIYPEAEAPVLIARGPTRRLGTMRWGWPPFGEVRRPVTNIRNLASPMWRAALEDPNRRCLVPVTAFSEWSQVPDPATGRKRKHWFALKDQDLFAFAGLWRPTAEGPRFAFLTCEANAVVGRVHPKAMPVILGTAEAAHRWLTSQGDAAAMQRPFADDAMAEIEVEEASPPPPPRKPEQPSLF
jgi:putative SOS response-associated peptidase YedK